MNPFFWILVLLGAVALWFALRGMFWEIGEKAVDIWEDTNYIIHSDNEQIETKNDEIDGGNTNA